MQITEIWFILTLITAVHPNGLFLSTECPYPRAFYFIFVFAVWIKSNFEHKSPAAVLSDHWNTSRLWDGFVVMSEMWWSWWLFYCTSLLSHCWTDWSFCPRCLWYACVSINRHVFASGGSGLLATRFPDRNNNRVYTFKLLNYRATVACDQTGANIETWRLYASLKMLANISSQNSWSWLD